MDNKTILEKAIQKAIDGGWIPEGVVNYQMKCSCHEYLHYDSREADSSYCSDCGERIKGYKTIASHYNDEGKTIFLWYTQQGKDESMVRDYEAVIFNHDFAKALWGEEWGSTSDGMEVYKVHLQQMVIADDPIEYLGDNI